MQQADISDLYYLMPPHYEAHEDAAGRKFYTNTVTGETSTKHPFDRFYELRGYPSPPRSPMHILQPIEETQGSDDGSMGTHQNNDLQELLNENDGDSQIQYYQNNEMKRNLNQQFSNAYDDLNLNHEDLQVQPVDLTTMNLSSLQSHNNLRDLGILTSAPTPQLLSRGGGEGGSGTRTNTKNNPNVLEYHCQWKERNLFGHLSVYGLTLRYNIQDGTTSVRFDGVSDSEWTFAALKGPYGAIEPHDLFVGAKIEIFGRHLTISSGNSHALHWIVHEAHRLQKLQEKFRLKIESVGHKPIVKPHERKVINHITRDVKTAGHVNLRKILNDTARLGEQLAQLGLAEIAMV
jgi:hypothetical protein